jgi:hypothetical protein
MLRCLLLRVGWGYCIFVVTTSRGISCVNSDWIDLSCFVFVDKCAAYTGYIFVT